jgi:hypothetical protein
LIVVLSALMGFYHGFTKNNEKQLSRVLKKDLKIIKKLV